jgi:hypothetical protein
VRILKKPVNLNVSVKAAKMFQMEIKEKSLQSKQNNEKLNKVTKTKGKEQIRIA